MADYCTTAEIKAQAEAPEASADAVFDALATSVSRMFDQMSEVPTDFFAVTDDTLKTLDFYIEKSQYCRVVPPILSDLTSVEVADTAIAATAYYQEGQFIVLSEVKESRTKISVEAKFGFSAIPADIKQACIEQAILMWRRRDLNFTEIAGVSSQVVASEYSPTFLSVSKEYRDKYGVFDYV